MNASKLLAGALLGAIGCNHNVQIPPSRPMALEAPRTLEAGERRGRLQLAHHGTLFEGSFDSGNLRLRTGLGDRAELSADAAIVRPESAPDAEHHIYLGRLGAKVAPIDSDNVALTAGVGGGFSPAAGTMASADLGILAGLDNRYLVPFIGASTFVSAPVEARPVVTGSEPDEIDTPTLTAGSRLTAGLALIRDRYTVAAGIDSTMLRDEDGEQHVVSIGLGIELALD